MASDVTRVGELSLTAFEARLNTGIGLQLGPFKGWLQVQCSDIVVPLHALYRDYPLLTDDNIFSFHVRLDERRRFAPQQMRYVRFSVDGRAPHEDMPAGQALAVLEWGINLVIALRSHCFLMLHAAVVERNSGAMLLPAAPGCGKTTLCAALTLHNWRLFSDEFGLLRPGGVDVTPLPRPMALKNQAIEVIRRFSPEAELGPSIPNTRKGTVAHLKPNADSIVRASQSAAARWIVYPQWQSGARTELEELSSCESFMTLANNAFNYELLGEAGFETVRLLIDMTRSFRLVYSELDDAIGILEELTDQDD